MHHCVIHSSGSGLAVVRTLKLPYNHTKVKLYYLIVYVPEKCYNQIKSKEVQFMRKLVTAGLSIALAGTLLTGCMRMDSNIVVDNDGSCTLSTEINIEKDAMLETYTRLLNEDIGGDGFTKDQVAVMLENNGIKLVKIDDKEYYKISSGTAGTNNNKFDSITNYYKSIISLLYQTEDDVLSLSETSFTIRQPANSNALGRVFPGNMEDSIGSFLKGKALRRADVDDYDDGYSDGLDKVVPWDDDDGDEYIDDDTGVTENNDTLDAIMGLLQDSEFMTSLNTATMTYTVTFPTKIKERSSNITLSNDDRTMSVTLPLATDRSYNEYAVCENDIAATGALNGIMYNEAVTVTIPENATAVLNGSYVGNGTIKCSKAGTYNFKLSDGKGTTETLCFIVDTSAPVISRQMDAGKAEFSDFYKGQEAFFKDGYIAIYDTESGTAGIAVDSNDVFMDTAVNIGSSTDKNSMISLYYIYSLNTRDLEEGSHVISVTDALGNSSEAEFIIDRTKPSVKGVKNGKTYKKAVKIKFYDKNGIKSATLNGKTFRKGSKTSKNGSYILKVTDNAENVKVVKFKIEK